MTNSETVVARLTAVHRAGGALLLLLDYDGTLAPLAAHPSLARFDDQVRRVLAKLAALPRVAVGVISGRSLADLKRRIGLDGIGYAGTGGMEIELRGRSIRHPDEAGCQALVDTVSAALTPALPEWPGAWIEQKCAGCTIHYRDVDPDRRAAFLVAVERALAPWASELELLSGPLALELSSRHGWHKGSAVEIMMQALLPPPPAPPSPPPPLPARQVFPCYVGDESNDAHAFRAVQAAGGIAIGIGSRAPAGADYRLRAPGDLADALSSLAATLGGEPLISRSSPSRV